ncbi:integrase catalytic domain-containing protein [Trichonephila clavipes]|nr:integrase catalytic domain-containing protein [Trichonephila clavipes]
MQREDSVLSTIIEKNDQNDVSPHISNYFINGEGLLCHLSSAPRDHPGLTPLESRVMGIQKRHISSYSAHVNGRVEKPNQSLANILASISQNTNDWDDQLPHTMLALNSAIHEATYTSPFFLEHGRDIRLSYTYEKNSDTPQNKNSSLLRKPFRSIPPLKGALGSTAITPIEKAEVIADSLQEQFQPNHVADREAFDQRIHEEVANFLATPHVQEIEPTTPTEVLTYVQRIKPKKSPDLIKFPIV